MRVRVATESSESQIRRIVCMVSRAFKTCLMLVEEMVKQRYFPQINEAMVKRLIIKHVGADDRTVQKYLRLLVDFAFLFPEQKRGDEVIYRLNLARLDVKQLTLLDVSK